jgi:hypothetical protein
MGVAEQGGRDGAGEDEEALSKESIDLSRPLIEYADPTARTIPVMAREYPHRRSVSGSCTTSDRWVPHAPAPPDINKRRSRLGLLLSVSRV